MRSWHSSRFCDREEIPRSNLPAHAEAEWWEGTGPMTPRITSAFLATSVHGVVLLLLLAAWRAPQVGEQGRIDGQRLTSVSLADARAETGETEPRQKRPAPRKPDRPAVQAPAPTPAVSPLSLPSVVPLPRPMQVVVGEAAPDSVRAATAMTQVQAQAPAGASATTSDIKPADASAGASAASAPARSSTGSNTFAARVFRHIQRKKEFPARLAQAGIRGRVLVRFNLTGAGEITDIAIIKSSGVAVLDGLALEQIRGAVPYPRPPKELSGAQLHFIVPMIYRPSA